MPDSALELLRVAGTGEGVRVALLTDNAAKEGILAYVVQGNTAQMNNPKFVEELKTWIRFSDEEAVHKRDGLSTRATGNPSIPRWLASPLFRWFFTVDSENEKYTKQIRSSSGIAVFSSEANNKTHWIETGRCYQRFALQATALGIRNAFLNQPVEVASLRPKFAASQRLGNRRPDLIVRFGMANEMPKSLRRSVESVLC